MDNNFFRMISKGFSKTRQMAGLDYEDINPMDQGMLN